MNTTIQDQLARAYQQTPLWRLQLPADAAAGIASAGWAPVVAELARHTGAGAPSADKQTAYAQVAHMLRDTQDQGAKSGTFGPAERIEFGNFVQALLNHYQRLLP